MKILYVTKISNSKASGLSVAVIQLLNSIYKYAKIDWLNLSSDDFEVSDYVKRKTEEDYLLSELPDIVIFESPFASLKFCRIAKELRKRKIPYVLSPHGSFHKEALKKGAFKKYVAINTVFKSFFKYCTAVQYLTYGEKNNSINMNNSIIIPNGIQDKKRYRIRNKIRNIVFIGRKLKHTKGLDILLEVCLELKDLILEKKINIHIYGPIENEDDEQYINLFIQKNEMSNYVFNHQAVFDGEKDSVLLNADLFIHTSRHEGFPMAVLEALTYGLPVLITEGTNMGDIIKNGQAGWVAQTNSRDVALKLKEAIESININDYSQNARNISLDYTWDAVSKRSIKIYEDLLNLAD